MPDKPLEQRVNALERSRAYWRKELSQPPGLDLPTDFARPAKPSEEAGLVTIDIPRKLAGRLREFQQSEGTTSFSILLAAFGTLLYRYTWEKDIVVGCPVAGRTHAEVEPLVGVFINTLPMRLRLEGTDTFREILHRVHQSTINGLKHQEVPLQHVVQDVLKDREASGSPLFQVMFVHENFPLSNRADTSLEFKPDDAPCKSSMVEISRQSSARRRMTT